MHPWNLAWRLAAPFRYFESSGYPSSLRHSRVVPCVIPAPPLMLLALCPRHVPSTVSCSVPYPVPYPVPHPIAVLQYCALVMSPSTVLAYCSPVLCPPDCASVLCLSTVPPSTVLAHRVPVLCPPVLCQRTVSQYCAPRTVLAYCAPLLWRYATLYDRRSPRARARPRRWPSSAPRRTLCFCMCTHAHSPARPPARRGPRHSCLVQSSMPLLCPTFSIVSSTSMLHESVTAPPVSSSSVWRSAMQCTMPYRVQCCMRCRVRCRVLCDVPCRAVCRALCILTPINPKMNHDH